MYLKTNSFEDLYNFCFQINFQFLFCEDWPKVNIDSNNNKITEIGIASNFGLIIQLNQPFDSNASFWEQQIDAVLASRSRNHFQMMSNKTESVCEND